MGNFYNPQPPAQGPVNSTLPLPHDPIPAQGDQPPRRQVAAVLAMCVVLASWPSDLEPRLQTPNTQQVKIAPLTLTYGSQPTPTAFLSATELRVIVDSWPGDLEPRLTWANVPRTTIAPLTLAYGSQPTPTSPLSTTELAQIVSTWPNPIGPLLPYQPIRSLVSSAPVVSQPQPQSPLSVLEVSQIVSTWTVTWDAQTASKSAAWNIPPQAILAHTPPPALIWTSWEPPYVKPPQPVSIAPLTLVYGSQPSPQPPLPRVAQTSIIASWPTDTGPLVAWQNATPTRIVPLTLPTGTPPKPHGPLAVTTLMQAVGTWTQTWDAQTYAKNASWNVPRSFNPIWAANANRTIGLEIEPQ